MKILFTGEQGQLARKIVELMPREWVAAEVPSSVKSKVSMAHPWPELDVRDLNAVEIAMYDAKPDVVVHSAAIVNTDKCAADPQKCVDTNLIGTDNVLRACRGIGAKLMYFSTTATYDPSAPRPFTEHATPQRAPTLYGITKYAGEMLVTGQDEVPHMVVRPCFVYGDPPYDHSSQLCRVAVHEALIKLWPEKAGPKPVVTLDPKALKDYMRVEDFAMAVIAIMKLDSWNGDAFNVSNQQARPMGQYFEYLRQAMDSAALHMAWKPEADYMGDHVVSSEKLRACTGWKAMTPISVGVHGLAAAALKYVADCRDGKNTLLYR